MNPEILLFIIKLILGGIVAFLAIMLMSKPRDAAWMSMVGGFLLSYVFLVYELLIKLGVLTASHICLAGIPISTLILTILPSICFIIGFILMIIKK